MKKKIALIVFTIVCTLGITVAIASFSLGANTTKSASNTGENLSSIYSSFTTQIQRIISNSNLADSYGDEVTQYHIVQIVDSMDDADSSGTRLADYLKNYINADANASGDAGNFKLDVIGKAMAEGKIDLQTYLATDENLASAISNADLIYLACNSGYISGSTDILNEGSSSNNAYDALYTYALNKFKPILIDQEVVGISDRDTSVDYDPMTRAYNYLYGLKQDAGTTKDDGVASVKQSDSTMSWTDFFDESNKKTTYVPFNNKANMDWCDYSKDYDSTTGKYVARDEDEQNVFKVLEVIPQTPTGVSDDALGKPLEQLQDTKFKSIIDDGTFASNAFRRSANVNKIEYEQISVEGLNKLVADAVASGKTAREVLNDYGYNFIYISHDSNEQLYFASGNTKHAENDFSANTITALKGFAKRTNEDRGYSGNAPTYVNRLIIDANFFSVYSYKSDSKSSVNVDTSAKIYQLSSQLVTIEDGQAIPAHNNVAIVSNGYFKTSEMLSDSSRASAVTALINRSTYRTYNPTGNGASFKVLEIEPYYTVDDTDWYNTKRSDLTKYLEQSTDQELYEASDSNPAFYRSIMTRARIAAATGLNVDQIDVTMMSANALCSTSPNLIEEYDLIYIGNEHSNIKDASDWNITKLLNGGNTISFSPFDLANAYSLTNPVPAIQDNAYVYTSYTHTGELTDIDDQFFYAGNWNGGQYIQSATRSNGSDITAKMYVKLYEYIKAGMPLICDDEVLSSDYLIGGASANAELVEDSDFVVSDTESLYRLKLNPSIKSESMTMSPNGQHSTSGGNTSYTFKVTTFDDDTTTARKESTIDPESYMYQLMYRIAEDEDSPIYHASNVFVGFDSTDVVESDNAYLESVTKDDHQTKPDEYEVVSGDKSVTEDDLKNKTTLLAGLDDGDTVGTLKIFSNKYVTDSSGNVDYAKSGAGVQLKHFLNIYASSRPVLNLILAPYDYDSSRDMEDTSSRKVNSKNPTYSFSVEGVTGTTYTIKLYYDFDGDGKFSDSATEGRLEGSTYDDECVATYEYTVGTDGIVTFNKDAMDSQTSSGKCKIDSEFIIDKDFVGVMPYKLVAIDSAGKQTSVTGYPKYYADDDSNKQTIRLLEIIPGQANGNMGAITEKVTTLCWKENTLQNGADNLSGNNKFAHPESNLGASCGFNHEFGIESASNTTSTGSKYNLAKDLSEYDIDLEIMTVGQFAELANAYLADYCENLDSYAVRDELTESEINDFKTKFKEQFYAGNGKLNSTWKDMTKTLTTTIYDFHDYGICDKIFDAWLSNGDTNNDLALETKNNVRGTQTFDAGYYDMIIIGFTKAMGGGTYDGCDLNNISCQFIKNYIKAGGNLLMGTDTTSYVGINVTQNLCWSRNINYYLKDYLGMDRFKFESYGTYNMQYSKSLTSEQKSLYTGHYESRFYDMFVSGAGNGYLYIPYTTTTYKNATSTDEYLADKKLPGEFFTMNSYAGTYEAANGNNVQIAGAGATDVCAFGMYGHTIYKGLTETKLSSKTTSLMPSTQVAMNNKGLITSYPFSISAYPRISATNGQSLALDTEDEDMQIWYSLAGADDSSQTGLYAADPLNGRSFYYMFTCGNITYTGAGFTPIAEETDNDEERKLLINAVLSKIKIHRSGPTVVFSKYTGSASNDSKFTAASGSNNTAVLECTAKDVSKINFDFKASTSSTRKLKKVVLFIDKNEDGIYDEGTDYLVKEYVAEANASGDETAENGDTAVVKNSELAIQSGISFTDDQKQLLTNLFQDGSFYLTIQATDSEDKSGYARLLVKTKSKLFNLN